MKKSLVALAALAVAGIASAQSSVTLFGVVDAGISGYSNKSDVVIPTLLTNPFLPGSIKVQRNALSQNGYNSSRVGFRGTEDLGGGLAASFWLESPIQNDNGQEGLATFARRSTVSLSGGFGEVRLGRDYTPAFWNDTVFDPFGTNGVGTNIIYTANGAAAAFLGGTQPIGAGFTNTSQSAYVRSSNSIGYFLPPNLGGFYGQVMYAFNERDKYDPGAVTPPAPNTQRTGRHVGGRFGYANGPLDVAVGYGETIVGDNFFAGTTSTYKTGNIGASWDFGVVKLFGEYSDSKSEVQVENIFATTTPDVDIKGWLLGATVPVGPGLIRAAYSAVKYDLGVGATGLQATLFGSRDDPKAEKFALGYVHNLSKRTALYATVAYIKNKRGAGQTVGGPAFVTSFGGAAYVPKDSTGYDVGIRHAF